MSHLVAHLALIAAAAFWGFGNIAQKTVLDHIGPVSATSLRCWIGAMVILPLVWLETQDRKPEGWWTSVIAVAAAFTAALAVQQAAYVTTTVTNASFLVNTATVLTPLAAWMMLGERTSHLGLMAAAMTLFGVFLMSNGLSGFAALNWGDVACLVSAVFYAVWMVALGRHVQRFGLPYSSAFIQFAFAAIIALMPALHFEPISAEAVFAAAPQLAVLGILSTAAAFCLQTVAQRHTTASKAAVLVSGESIFGATGAYMVLNERPSAVVVMGAATIFLAILVVALVPDGKKPIVESA